jgi:AGZA family xanthine/uracil permease-like MFS transporter
MLGMGINAYFTYTVVGWRGTGMVSYQSALSAILIEGVIFLILALTGVRYAIAKLIPEPIRLASAPGIGALLAHIGFQTAEGLGLVVSDIATAVTLGGCPPDKRTPIVAYDDACAIEGLCVTSDAYTCDVLGGQMTSATTWLGIAGLIMMVVFLAYKESSGIIVGILFVTFVSWFRNTAVTYFPYTVEGDARFVYFSQIVAVEPMNKITAQYSSDLQSALVALFTFLYVDFLDTTGTLLGIVSHMNLLDENGDFPRSKAAFSVDAIATMVGSVFGLSPVSSYAESAAGVEAGGRTGLTAVFVGLYFALSIFFAPIFASIPPWATGGSLIIVGAFMCRSLAKVQWERVDHAVTAFVTIMLMPLTYSIAYGIIGGFFCWITLQFIFFAMSLVGLKIPEDLSNDVDDLKAKADPAIEVTNRGITIDDDTTTPHKDACNDFEASSPDDDNMNTSPELVKSLQSA